jgi:hypothetical protein
MTGWKQFKYMKYNRDEQLQIQFAAVHRLALENRVWNSTVHVFDNVYTRRHT